MFDGQKIKSAAPNEVEHDVLIHDKFSKVVSFPKHGLETIQQGLRFQRPDRMGQEGTARLWKAAEGRDDIVEEAAHQPPKSRPAFGFKKQAEGV